MPPLITVSPSYRLVEPRTSEPAPLFAKDPAPKIPLLTLSPAPIDTAASTPFDRTSGTVMAWLPRSTVIVGCADTPPAVSSRVKTASGERTPESTLYGAGLSMVSLPNIRSPSSVMAALPRKLLGSSAQSPCPPGTPGVQSRALVQLPPVLLIQVVGPRSVKLSNTAVPAFPLKVACQRPTCTASPAMSLRREAPIIVHVTPSVLR